MRVYESFEMNQIDRKVKLKKERKNVTQRDFILYLGRENKREKKGGELGG